MSLFTRPAERWTFEDAFIARYAQLLRAATAMTGDRGEAEDLVQEAFVRVSLAQPKLRDQAHLDAYLHCVLRNLHWSLLRRRRRQPQVALDVLDYDCATFAARALLPSEWAQSREVLTRVCAFVCQRRQSSSAASIFLLRFFHELAPSEIAAIARMSRGAVDMAVTRCRADARAFLDDPASRLACSPILASLRAGGGAASGNRTPAAAAANELIDETKSSSTSARACTAGRARFRASLTGGPCIARRTRR